ncbi:saccharopine dehydrogenase NADP-binding domain-containing protein [Sphingobacterium sp. LRF_L2]|uniref:saccharopine dehydrogenase NADP-binding domain-containing protein n=1 Tax=Sphingobacterium sp. LRF_L2 TaxID=3369421 RepID=UPI003F5EE031
MDNRNKVMVIGGYGAVGKQICQFLSSKIKEQIVVAGRDIKQAEALCTSLPGSEARAFDCSDPNFGKLADVSVVMMCVELADTAIVAYCIRQHIHYIDITANPNLTNRIEALEMEFPPIQSLILLSIGLAPGVSNLLTKNNIQQQPLSTWADINILLGLGEKHGQAAFEWTFNNFHQEYRVQQAGKQNRLLSFTNPKAAIVDIKRRFFLFNFSDQHVLSKEWPDKQITTRMAFDSRLITELIHLCRKLGVTKIFRFKKIQRLLFHLFHRYSFGSDIFYVQAKCGTEQQLLHTSSFSGYSEGTITAAVAAEIVGASLISTKKGIMHIHNFIDDVPSFLKQVSSYDNSFKIEL